MDIFVFKKNKVTLMVIRSRFI